MRVPSRSRHPFLLPGAFLGFVACGFILPFCIRCFLPAEVDYNEGWNAVRQAQAWIPHALYGRPPELSVTNYPPLSFHLVGALAGLGVDVVLAGRLLSLLAIAATGACLARITRRMTGSRVLAACSMFGWIAGLELWTPGRIGVDDPQLLATTFEAGGLVVFLRRPAHGRHLVLAACLTVAGLFIKHSLIALPLGITCSLLVRPARRPFAVWIGACASVSIAMTGLTLAYDGHLFFRHLLSPRLFVPERAVRLGLSFAALSSPMLAVVGWWAWRERGSTQARPLIFAWLASLAEIGAFAGGDGVGKSILQDAIMLTALLQPIALQQVVTHGGAMKAAWRRRAAAAAPCLLLLVPAALASQSREAWTQLVVAARQGPEEERSVMRLHDAPGPVLCEDLLLCFRAGRASFFDAYYVTDQIELGRLPTARIDDLVTSRRLAMVEVGTADDPDLPEHRSARFTPSFTAALRANYRPVFRSRVFSIYVPDGMAASADRR